MINIEFFKQLMPWIINLGYFVAVVPQVVLNFKRKSTKGLSELYLLGYFNGYLATLLYVYNCRLPLPYLIFVPITFFTVSVLLLQHFFYDKDSYDFRALRFYVLDFILVMGFIPFAMFFPKIAGEISGWVAMLIWSVYFIPQIVRIYLKKSVEGFSFLLVSLIGVGNLIELVVALTSGFPLQTHLIALRGIIFYIIFCVQFWLYGKKR